jgi:hypothetical protein
VPTNLKILIASNMVIGLSFLVVPGCALWLYFHRHRDWPRAWALLLVGISLAACGFSRIVHAVTYYYWPKMDADFMTLADLVTAITAFVTAALCPWAVYTISKLPTPDDIRIMAEKEHQAKHAAAMNVRMAHEKEITQSKLDRLKAILQSTGLTEDLKNRILEALEA